MVKFDLFISSSKQAQKGLSRVDYNLNTEKFERYLYIYIFWDKTNYQSLNNSISIYLYAK